jgi:hypothetical protein
MSLTLTTNPVGTATSKLFAGLKPIEYVFKREDLAVTTVVSGTGGVKINHAGDLSAYLVPGDSIYLHSHGTNYTYDATGTILTIIAGEITVDIPYIESGTGGYINYLKNYYVKLQCVHPTLSDVNLLPFSLQSDGDAAGNIKIDVSIVNDLNRQRGAMAMQHLITSRQQFEIKYRQVYTGSAESFTLVDNSMCIVLYSKDNPGEDDILNNFSLPKIFLGYPASFVLAHKADAPSATMELLYVEQDINNSITALGGTLGSQASDVNGFLQWIWAANKTVNANTKYIHFNLDVSGTYDFKVTDFAYPDFRTQ